MQIILKKTGKNSITSTTTPTRIKMGLSVVVAELATDHTANINNPHNVTGEQVGLGNVDNTSDANKPISISQATKNISQDNEILNLKTNSRTLEELQDAIAAMFQNGTHTNASINYDDATGTIDITASGGGSTGSQRTQEEIEDFVGGLVTQGNGINVNYDDAGNVLTISLSGESFTTALRNKLHAIEGNATADQTDLEIKTAYENETTLPNYQDRLKGESDTVRIFSSERVSEIGSGLLRLNTTTTNSVSIFGIDIVNITALAQNVTMTSYTSGAVTGQRKLFMITGDGITRNVDWTAYNSNLLTFPNSIVANTTYFVVIEFDSVWRLVHSSSVNDANPAILQYKVQKKKNELETLLKLGVNELANGGGTDDQIASEVDMTGYTKPASGGAISPTDSVDSAIGKLEKDLENATAGGGDVNVQSDWNITDTSSDAFIQNKPITITTVQSNKLAGIATGATANDTDAQLRARSSHTGTQTVSTISDFDTEVSNNADVTANTAKISYTDASKVAGIENNATADQTDAEIETAYNNRVLQASSSEQTAGTSTSIRRYSVADVKNMIDIHSSSTGSPLSFVSASSGFTASTSTIYKTVRLSNAFIAGVTIPTFTDAQVPVGSYFEVIQEGVGGAFVTGSNGVKINGVNQGLFSSSGKGSRLYVFKTALNEWTVSGIEPNNNNFQSIPSNASITPNLNVSSALYINALAVDANINSPVVPQLQEGLSFIVRIKDDGTARALTFDPVYRAVGVTLPTTTTAGKTMYFGMKYNEEDTKWDILAFSEEA